MADAPRIEGWFERSRLILASRTFLCSAGQWMDEKLIQSVQSHGTKRPAAFAAAALSCHTNVIRWCSEGLLFPRQPPTTQLVRRRHLLDKIGVGYQALTIAARHGWTGPAGNDVDHPKYASARNVRLE